MITNCINEKIIYNKLNLDYNRFVMSYEDQTNKTVSKIMNNFIDIYKNDFNNKIFILMYNDDIYSLISYYILKNIQGVYSFNLKVYGENKITKFCLNKKDTISSFKFRTIKKIKQDDIVYISCFNPIYKVKNNTNVFNKIGDNSCFNIIKEFTPTQFKILSEFFGIDKIKKERVRNNILSEFNTLSFKEFNHWVSMIFYKNNQGLKTYENSIFSNQLTLSRKEYFDNLINEKDYQFCFVHLEGNENDFNIYDEIRMDCNNKICFYLFGENEVDSKFNFTKQNLNYYINPANVLTTGNYNNYTLIKDLLDKNNDVSYNLIGNWSIEEKQKIGVE